MPRLQYTGAMQEFYDIDTEIEVNRVSLDAQGGAVSISCGFEALIFRARNSGSEEGVVILRVKRGATTLRQKWFYINTESTEPGRGSGIHFDFNMLTLLDVPPSGEQVYTVTLESRGLNVGLSAKDKAAYPVKIYGRSLHIMGVKR